VGFVLGPGRVGARARAVHELAGDVERLAQELHARLHLALHGSQTRLRRPPVETRSVVLERKPKPHGTIIAA
jgi:hypothetical protein